MSNHNCVIQLKVIHFIQVFPKKKFKKFVDSYSSCSYYHYHQIRGDMIMKFVASYRVELVNGETTFIKVTFDASGWNEAIALSAGVRNYRYLNSITCVSE